MIWHRVAVIAAGMAVSAACVGVMPVTNMIGTPAASLELTKSARQSPWKLIFDDQFNRNTLGSKWGAYGGVAGGNPAATWKQEQVSVGNGKLRIRASKVGSRIISSGVSNYPIAQTYGKWSLRVKVQKSADLKYVILLWPTHGWPPEINLAEDFGGNRKTLQSFLHFGEDNQQIQRTLRGANLSKWHEVGVEWQPGKLRFLIDGKVWSRINSSQVPAQPMWLGVQTEGLRAATRSTPKHTDLLIDRVRVWSWNP